MITGAKEFSQEQINKASKFLSFVLRHKPDAIGLTLDSQGWASIPELIEKSVSEITLTNDLVKQVVTTNDKQRFLLSEDEERIRANQGHSIKVNLDLTPKKPPTILYHGTAARFLSSIQKDGLRPGQRHYVHLSIDTTTAAEVGQRYGKPIVLEICSGEMNQKGFKFFLTKNGVWLTDHVPPRFLTTIN